MIEKRLAVENLEAILRVPGIDMVQFGPSDYGLSIGKAGRSYATGLHPEVLEARKYTIKTAMKMGVRPRAEITSVAEAEYYLDSASRTSTCPATLPSSSRTTPRKAPPFVRSWRRPR